MAFGIIFSQSVDLSRLSYPKTNPNGLCLVKDAAIISSAEPGLNYWQKLLKQKERWVFDHPATSYSQEPDVLAFYESPEVQREFFKLLFDVTSFVLSENDVVYFFQTPEEWSQGSRCHYHKLSLNSIHLEFYQMFPFSRCEISASEDGELLYDRVDGLPQIFEIK
jgi:hypothetical protein